MTPEQFDKKSQLPPLIQQGVPSLVMNIVN